MKTRITNYIRAAYPCLYIVSAEEQRVESELKSVADALQYSLWYWTPVNGLVNVSTGTGSKGVGTLISTSESAQNGQNAGTFQSSNSPMQVILWKQWTPLQRPKKKAFSCSKICTCILIQIIPIQYWLGR